jgi:hypothetical protein
MFSISRYELIEAIVDSGKEVVPAPGQNLRNSLQVGTARAAELSLVQVISSALRTEHL